MGAGKNYNPSLSLCNYSTEIFFVEEKNNFFFPIANEWLNLIISKYQLYDHDFYLTATYLFTKTFEQNDTKVALKRAATVFKFAFSVQ
jgi:hypothetical protein